MALTAEQMEQRRHVVGASDVAAICGQNPYRSAIDVYNEKVYSVEPDRPSQAANLGSMLEGALRDLAADALKLPVHATNLYRELAGTRIGVNLDGWTEVDGRVIPVELKTAGILSPWSSVVFEWGDEWTDQVPMQYLIQVMTQMMALDAPFGYVSALIGERGHVMYRIERQDDVCRYILEAVERFWACVESRTMPAESAPIAVDILARIRRVPASTCRFDELAARAVLDWQKANRARKCAEAEEEQAKALVVQLLGECEGALIDWTDNQVRDLASVLDLDDLTQAEQRVALTYLAQGRDDVDRDILRSRFPEAWEASKRRTTYRVLRLGKAKPGMAVNAQAPRFAAAEGGAA